MGRLRALARASGPATQARARAGSARRPAGAAAPPPAATCSTVSAPVMRTVTVRTASPLRASVRPGQPARPRRRCCCATASAPASRRSSPFVDALDPGVEVIRFDVPGVGGSPPPPCPYRFPGSRPWSPAAHRSSGHRRVRRPRLLLGRRAGPAARAAAPRAACRRLVLVATGTGALMVPAPARGAGAHAHPAAAPRPGLRRDASPARSTAAACASRPRARARCCTRHRGWARERGYYYQLAGRHRLDQPAVPAAGRAAHAGAGRRRRPDHPAGQRPDDAPADPRLAAARLPRRPPGAADRRRRAGAGDRPGSCTPTWNLEPEESPRDRLHLARPAPSSDFLGSSTCSTTTTASCSSGSARSCPSEVEPVINDYWTRGGVPARPGPRARRARHRRPRRTTGHGCPGRRPLLDGMVAMELARVDPSIATFMGVHGGLAMGSIHLCGSEEQKRALAARRWRGMELIGAFGLTEPDVGSGRRRAVSRPRPAATATSGCSTARRSGSATPRFADLVDHLGPRRGRRPGQGLRRREGHPRHDLRRIEDKIALRVVQNAQINLDGVRVPEANRLQEAHSFARHRQGAADDPGRGRLAGRRLRARRLRARAALRQGARAVRPADRRLPAGPGPAGPDARQRHRLGRHVRPALPAAGRRRG